MKYLWRLVDETMTAIGWWLIVVAIAYIPLRLIYLSLLK
jgi:hypothetical protein